MKHLIIIVSMVMLFSGCSKDSKSGNTFASKYLIIGEYGGFVPTGIKGKFYLVQAANTQQDTTVDYASIPTSDNGFHFDITLSPSITTATAPYLDSVPTELLNNNGKVYGSMMPDAPMLDVRYKNGTQYYKWTFQYDISNCSNEIQQFINGLKSKLNI